MCCGSDAARPSCGAAARVSSIIFCHSLASVQVSDIHLSCHSSMLLLSGVTSFPLIKRILSSFLSVFGLGCCR